MESAWPTRIRLEQGTVPRPTVIPSAPAEKINLVELEKKCNFATAYVYVHQRKDIAKMTQENKDIKVGRGQSPVPTRVGRVLLGFFSDFGTIFVAKKAPPSERYPSA